MNDELLLVDRSLQVGGPFQPLHHGLLQRGLVHLVTTLAAGLGRVHGHVCRLEQVGRVFVLPRAEGDADAGVHLNLAVLDRQRAPSVRR